MNSSPGSPGRRVGAVVGDDLDLDAAVGLPARTRVGELVLRLHHRDDAELGRAVHLVQEPVAELLEHLQLQRVRHRGRVRDEATHRREVGSGELTGREAHDPLHLGRRRERVRGAVLLHQAQPRGGIEPAEHDDRPAHRVRDRREGKRTRVVQRPGGDVDLFAEAESELAEQCADQGRVGRGPQRSLGLAGGPRGVEHLRTDVGLVGRLRLRVGLRGEDVVPRAGTGRDVAAEHEDLAHLRDPVADLGHGGSLFGVDDDQGGVGVVDHIRHLVGVEPVRERHRDLARLAGRVDRHEDLERVRPAPDDPLALHDTELSERVREPVHLLVESEERGGRRRPAQRLVDDHRRRVRRGLRVQRQQIVGHAVSPS